MRRGSLDYVRDVFAKAGTNRVVVDYINVKWLEDSDAVITNEDPMLRGITCGWLQMRDAASPPSRNGRGGAPPTAAVLATAPSPAGLRIPAGHPALRAAA